MMTSDEAPHKGGMTLDEIAEAEGGPRPSKIGTFISDDFSGPQPEFPIVCHDLDAQERATYSSPSDEYKAWRTSMNCLLLEVHASIQEVTYGAALQRIALDMACHVARNCIQAHEAKARSDVALRAMRWRADLLKPNQTQQDSK